MKRFLRYLTILIPWVLGAQPEPGDLFREYVWTNPADPTEALLRVGGELDYRNDPAVAHRDGHILWPQSLDLEDVDRVELVVEKLLSRAGTTGFAVQWNEGDWQEIPEPTGIPVPRHERPHLYNAIVPIDPKSLRDSDNTFRFRIAEMHASGQPRQLVYGVLLRVYYKPRRKNGVRGEILLPRTGETLGEDVQLVADLTEGARRIEYLAKYRDVNWAGDGEEYRWQYFFHHGQIRNIIAGTDNLLKSEFWDTRWLPDQEAPIELAARVYGADGLIYFTEPVTGLRLERDFSVAIVFPEGQPTRWTTRNGRFSATLSIPGQPNRATAARLYWSSWSPCYSEGIYLNGVEVYRGADDPCAEYVQHEVALPPAILRPGRNELVTAQSFPRDGEPVHGMDMLFPGPTLKIRYGQPASPPKELFQRAPDRIFYTVVDTVVSKNFPPPSAPVVIASEPVPDAAAEPVHSGDSTALAVAPVPPKAVDVPAPARITATEPTRDRPATAPVTADRPTPTDVAITTPMPKPATATSTADKIDSTMPEDVPRSPAVARGFNAPGADVSALPDPVVASQAQRQPAAASAARPEGENEAAMAAAPRSAAGTDRSSLSPSTDLRNDRSAADRPAPIPANRAEAAPPATPKPERTRNRRSRRPRTVVPTQGSAHSQRSYAGLYQGSGPGSPFRRAMLLGDAVWQDYEVVMNAKLLMPPMEDWAMGGTPIPYFALATHLTDYPNAVPGDSLGATAEFYVLPDREAYLWRIVRDDRLLAEKMSNYPSLELGRDYQVKFRAEAKGSEILYRVKCWPEGAPEPQGWDLEGRDPGPADIGGYALLLPEEQAISFSSVELDPIVSEVRILETEDEGQAAFRIETPGATYLYQGAAGGFSSIVDRNGNDWIDFHANPAPAFPAAAGNAYRGLPNLVFGGDNDGAGHPGFGGCVSERVDESRIRTRTLDGKWQWTWTFFDHYAELEVERVDPEQAYWFLYEGPPAGRWDPAAAFWFTDQGEMPADSLPDYYAGTSRVDQFRWAAFGQTYYDQIFYVAQRQVDELPDLGGYLGSTPAGLAAPDGMVVFGFGRGAAASPQLRRPERFVIGFTDQLPYRGVKEIIEGRLR